jgi:hypothetical protein
MRKSKTHLLDNPEVTVGVELLDAADSRHSLLSAAQLAALAALISAKEVAGHDCADQ